MTPLALRMDRAYRARIRSLRDGARIRVETEWGALTIDELDAKFPGFVERAAKALTVAQVQGVIATRAYLRGMVRAETRQPFELAPQTDVAGTAEVGTIPEAMAPIRSMVFGKLGESRDPEAAMAMGLYLVGRFADNEVTRAVDTEMTAQATAPDSPVKGWLGTVYGATDRCAGNAGFHSFDERFYRHPGCKCDRSVVFDEIA